MAHVGGSQIRSFERVFSQASLSLHSCAKVGHGQYVRAHISQEGEVYCRSTLEDFEYDYHSDDDVRKYGQMDLLRSCQDNKYTPIVV